MNWNSISIIWIVFNWAVDVFFIDVLHNTSTPVFWFADIPASTVRRKKRQIKTVDTIFENYYSQNGKKKFRPKKNSTTVITISFIRVTFDICYVLFIIFKSNYKIVRRKSEGVCVVQFCLTAMLHALCYYCKSIQIQVIKPDCTVNWVYFDCLELHLNGRAPVSKTRKNTLHSGI